MNQSAYSLSRRIADFMAIHDVMLSDSFALCPVVDADSADLIRQALLSGRIPIVITDSFELPRFGSYDPRDFLFQIGTCLSELELLGAIGQLPCTKIQQMIAAGQRVCEHFFTKEQSPLRARLTDVDFPARLPDGRLLRESDLFRRVRKTFHSRVLIFGAGKYARRMLEALAERSQIVGIADDMAVGSLFGVPIQPGCTYVRTDFDAVFLATDSMEDRFASRVEELYGADVPLLRPSILMDHQLDAEDDDEPYQRPCCWPAARYPSKLEGVVVCVGYSDMLSWSLPQNVKQFDRFVVVTSSEDHQTQAVVKDCRAELVISDRFRDGGARFNKGKMLNDGFQHLDMDSWVLVTDADIVFRQGMRQRLFSRLLNERSLYYATRFNTPDKDREAWLQRWFDQPAVFQELFFSDPGSNQMPWGYFQLFYGANTNRYSEEFASAGEVDYEFQARWPAAHRVLLPEAVIHIAHGPFGGNWQGRKSLPLAFRSV